MIAYGRVRYRGHIVEARCRVAAPASGKSSATIDIQQVRRTSPTICPTGSRREVRKHTRGKPYHPMTQTTIERWHLSLTSASCSETTTFPAISNTPLQASSSTTNPVVIARAWIISLRPTSSSSEEIGSGIQARRSSNGPSSNADGTSTQQHELQPDDRTFSWFTRSNVPKILTTDRPHTAACGYQEHCDQRAATPVLTSTDFGSSPMSNARKVSADAAIYRDFLQDSNGRLWP